MADDVNALTPLPPPRLPTEAEYEAMCAAFVETERGRWFLAEYAKRNRNADTTMVIEAIGRIEAAVARQAAVDRAASATAVAQAMAETRQRAERILAAEDTALDGLRRDAQKIRDIAWTLREWGTDTAICDELDSLATTITAGCDAAALPPARVLALFDAWDGEAGVTEMQPDAPPPAIEAPAPVAAAEPAPEPAAKPAASTTSLGAALLAQGIIPAPARGTDVLAPLRRMSQAEKIAFFT